MIKKVKKRDGSIVDYDPSKIEAAIQKAFDATGECNIFIDQVFRDVYKYLSYCANELQDIEFIQDVVECGLMRNHYHKTAKAYILYRHKHAELREEDILVNNLITKIDKYLNNKTWLIKENSNMDYSLQGLNNYIANLYTKEYWLNKVYPKEIRDAHESGAIHLHDLGLFCVYCCGWDLMDLIQKGLGGVKGKLTAGAPKHFSSVLGQIVNFFYTLQGEAAGAQAFSNFDTLLAPFVYYDGLSFEQVKQYLQNFIFNINIPTRVGFQTPFTNITMDLVVPEYMKDMQVLIGNEIREKKYGDFQPEMDMINKAFCEIMIDGDAAGNNFPFPIPTYNVTKEFDWDNENLKPLWEMTAKYGTPYFSNFVNSDMKPEDVRSMCCRLRIDNTELQKRGGSLFGSNPMTGSIGVVTINLPQLGYKTIRGLISEQTERIDTLLELARKSLLIKRKILETYTELGLYPYSKVYLESVKRKTGSYWGNHFNTIGIIGMNEYLSNMTIGGSISLEGGKREAIAIMKYIRKKLQQFQEEDGVLYNLEATPGEGTTYRLAKLDKENYPDIITAGADEPYYTNSTQLPVGHSKDLFEVLEHQDDLQTMYTGGTVLHGFIEDTINDPETIKRLVKKVFDNFKLPYFTVTPSFSVCEDHGYIGGETHKCPTCHKDTEVYSRVVGFYRPIRNWNKGKKEEFKDRLEFEINNVKI